MDGTPDGRARSIMAALQRSVSGIRWQTNRDRLGHGGKWVDAMQRSRRRSSSSPCSPRAFAACLEPALGLVVQAQPFRGLSGRLILSQAMASTECRHGSQSQQPRGARIGVKRLAIAARRSLWWPDRPDDGDHGKAQTGHGGQSVQSWRQGPASVGVPDQRNDSDKGNPGCQRPEPPRLRAICQPLPASVIQGPLATVHAVGCRLGAPRRFARTSNTCLHTTP